MPFRLPWTRRPNAELLEQRERLNLQLECRELQKAVGLLENAANWVGYRDPWNFAGDQRLADAGVPVSSNNDYLTGSDYPVFKNEQDLKLIRDAARLLSKTNGYVIGALRALIAFVIGKGYRYKVAAKTGVKPKDVQDQAQAAQAHLDEFIRLNVWAEFEQEIFKRSRVEGETILRFFDREDGFVDVRTVEPEQLTQPPEESGNEWTYGVHVDPKDHFKVLGYWITYSGNPADGEEVPPGDIEHIKVNVNRIVKRGLSDLFCIDDTATNSVKLLRNMQIGASVQAAIAFIRQHTAASKAQVESFADASAFAKLTPTGTNGKGPPTRKTKIEPGTIVDINEGQEYKDPPLASKNTQNFIAILQAALRCLSTRWNAPEFITGDASNANYSSALVAESPFVRTSELEQEFYKVRFVRVMTRVLKAGVAAGKLSSDTLDLLEVQAEAPTMAVRNTYQDAQRNEIRRRNGVLSPRTWADQDGLDYEQEVENGAAIEPSGFQPAAGGVGPSPGGAAGITLGNPVHEGKGAGALPFPFRVA